MIEVALLCVMIIAVVVMIRSPRYRTIRYADTEHRKQWRASTMFCDILQRRLRVGDICGVSHDGTIVIGEVIEFTNHGTTYRVLPVGDPERCTNKVIVSSSETSLLLNPSQVNDIMLGKLSQ